MPSGVSVFQVVEQRGDGGQRPVAGQGLADPPDPYEDAVGAGTARNGQGDVRGGGGLLSLAGGGELTEGRGPVALIDGRQGRDGPLEKANRCPGLT
jgi:hypothetical protein